MIVKKRLIYIFIVFYCFVHMDHLCQRQPQPQQEVFYFVNQQPGHNTIDLHSLCMDGMMINAAISL